MTSDERRNRMNVAEIIIMAAQQAAGVEPDGKLGPRTLAALREYDDEHDEFDCPEDAERLVIYVAQHAAGLTGKALDGVPGPTTERAAQEYLARHSVSGGVSPAMAVERSSGMAVWEPHEGPDIYAKDGIDLRGDGVITPPGGLADIPTRKTMNRVYGDAKVLGKEGMKQTLVKLEGLPGRFNRGDGVLRDLHPLVAPHLRLALELCERFGVIDEIYRIGTFNYRHMRHDPSKPLSFHSYGICVDVNPRENFGWVPTGDEKAVQPFSKDWYQKYPRGLSEAAVLCFRKAGFAWGGSWPSFRDPMHFELVR